jgi:hypothetical protein
MRLNGGQIASPDEGWRAVKVASSWVVAGQTSSVETSLAEDSTIKVSVRINPSMPFSS